MPSPILWNISSLWQCGLLLEVTFSLDASFLLTGSCFSLEWLVLHCISLLLSSLRLCCKERVKLNSCYYSYSTAKSSSNWRKHRMVWEQPLSTPHHPSPTATPKFSTSFANRYPVLLKLAAFYLFFLSILLLSSFYLDVLYSRRKTRKGFLHVHRLRSTKHKRNEEK